MARTDPDETPRGTWRDWWADRLLRLSIRAAHLIPLKPRLKATSWIMRRVLAGPTGYRERARANLAYIWPDRAEAERHRIAEQSLDNAARTLIELFDLRSLRDRMANVVPEGPGVAVAEAARAESRPVIFVTGHYGNFDAPRTCLVAQGFEIGGLYRPLSNPYFNEFYSEAISTVSGPAFAQGRRGTINLLRHLKEGGMTLLLFDVYDSGGVAIPFLGQPAPTLTSVAEIALKTDAVIIPHFGIRQPDGVTFRAIFEDPIAPGPPEEMMRALTQRLEARILEDPGQWYWIHRRWKPERQARRQRKTAAPKMAP